MLNKYRLTVSYIIIKLRLFTIYPSTKITLFEIYKKHLEITLNLPITIRYFVFYITILRRLSQITDQTFNISNQIAFLWSIKTTTKSKV